MADRRRERKDKEGRVMRTTHHKYTIIKSLHARVTGHAHHLMDITCVALLILFSVTLSSCRKELCYNHWEHSMSVKADVDATYLQEWEQTGWSDRWDAEAFGVQYEDLTPDTPSGLKVVSYRQSGGYEERNVEPEGAVVPLSEGYQSILFYNNDTEYIVFDNTGSSATAVATTRTRTRFSLSGQESSETRGVNSPDMLYGSYLEDWYGERKIEPDYMPVEMKPLVFTYLLLFDFDSGFRYVKKARGELQGMAAGVYLNSGTTVDESATVLFEEEVCTVDTDREMVRAEVRSFGIPGYPNGSYASTRAEDLVFRMVLEVEMTNGATKKFETDISQQMASQPHGGVITVSGLVITDEEGGAAGGGFQVDVDGWGDYEDIPLPLG